MYISVTYSVHSSTFCTLMAGRTRLRLANPPPPTIPPTLLYMTPVILQEYDTHDITGVVKNYLKNQQCILCGRVCYKTLTINIRLLYLYSKSSVATGSTGEPPLLQHFKVVFLEIQNVQIQMVFVNPVTYTQCNRIGNFKHR